MNITDKIAEGRQLLDEAQHRPWLAVQNSKGENWPIAHFGCGHDGNDYDLTSDGVRASDHRGDAQADCALAAHAVNHLAALLDIAEAVDIFREFVNNPRDNGVGEIEARAHVFDCLRRFAEGQP